MAKKNKWCLVIRVFIDAHAMIFIIFLTGTAVCPGLILYFIRETRLLHVFGSDKNKHFQRVARRDGYDALFCFLFSQLHDRGGKFFFGELWDAVDEFSSLGVRLF